MSRLTRALQHRNYRLFFAGQGVSLVGTWVTPHRLGAAPRRDRLRRTDPAAAAGASRRRAGGPLEPPPHAGDHAVLSALQSLALAVLALTGRITLAEVIWLQAARSSASPPVERGILPPPEETPMPMA